MTRQQSVEERYTAEPVRKSLTRSSECSVHESQTSVETDQRDDATEAYILLDECFSGQASQPSQTTVAQSLSGQAGQQSTPSQTCYYNLDNSIERSADAADDMYQSPKPFSAALSPDSTRNSDSCEYDFPAASPRSIGRQDSEVEEAIWNCHSALVTVTGPTGRLDSLQEIVVPKLNARAAISHSSHSSRASVERPDSSATEYDIPPPVVRPAPHSPITVLPAVTGPTSITPPHTPPKAHAAVSTCSKMHRYINTAPIPVRPTHSSTGSSVSNNDINILPTKR